MPTYEYVCTQCGERLEVFLRFAEEPPTECPVCGGVLRKVFHPAGILFKGSGFYKTDSRSSSKSGSEASESKSSESKSSESKPTTSTGSSSESKGSSDSKGSGSGRDSKSTSSKETTK